MNRYAEDIAAITQQELPWEKLSECNILIMGATGLIGSCIVDVLMARHDPSCHVYAAGRNQERAVKRFAAYKNYPNFHFLIHDITQQLDVDIPFHFIIDAASNASPKSFTEQPVEVMKANIRGVTHLVEYGLAHHLKRMLFVSSGEVYGEGNGVVFTEDFSGYIDCMKPRSCYPSSKRAAETLCAAYIAEYGADIVVARPCHIYGPYFTENDNRVYAQFIRNVLAGEDIIMKSEGKQFRSWCYVADCVSGLLHILLKGEVGQAYNIADESSNITIRELAEMIAEIGHQQVVITPPSLLTQYPSPITQAVFDTHRLQQLGWHINGNMKDKLMTTIREMQDN